MTILELSSSLSKLQNNEKSIFSAMLEREAKREKTLEGIAREKRLKAAQKRPQSGAAKLATEAMDEIFTSTEEEFFKAIDDGSGSFRDEAQARIREFNDTLQQQQQGSA